MTDSNVAALRPPDNPPPGPEWKPIPGAPGYEASHRGKYRSVDRMSADGRKLKGRELSIRLQNRTREDDTVYAVGDVRRADGSKWTDTVHSFVLRAHDRAPEPGEECCHGPGGPLDNRWPENIRWGTKAENEADKPRPVREPVPPRLCVNHERCGGYAVQNGRRCQGCRVELGCAAALLFEGGADPEQVAKALNYGSANGAYRLAVDLGGMQVIVPRRGDPPSPRRWLRSVIIRGKAWLADSDAQ